ncbi:MAG: glutathione peroxidase [Bacteroidetes bacterium]|nr:MAG: glutathione peroxidase [Bacteroidota bacterium]
MKLLLLLASLGAVIYVTSQTLNMKPVSAPAGLYDFTMETLDGQQKSLADYKGKVVLVVNTASMCGLTPQYADLQALHEKYESQGLVVLGFPANNFLFQEPGSNENIAQFCQKNYGVSFQMFAKISVKGWNAHPLYKWLKSETGESPDWNFSKYLIDKEGNAVQFIHSRTTVKEPEVIAAIEKLL